jgi:hypothetical protein
MTTEAKPAQASTDAGTATTTTDPKTQTTPATTVVGDAATGTQAAGAGDGKTTTAGATETGKADGAVETKPGPPAKYELTLPEGGQLEESDLAYVAEVAKAAGWTNEEAQAAVNEQAAAIKAQSDRWLSETKSDKTYGGDKLEVSQRLARAVISKIRPEGHPRRDAFLRFINRGGAGNHVEVVAFLADLGKLMAEDGAVGGSGGGPGDRTAEDVLYGQKSA